MKLGNETFPRGVVYTVVDFLDVTCVFIQCDVLEKQVNMLFHCSILILTLHSEHNAITIIFQIRQ